MKTSSSSKICNVGELNQAHNVLANADEDSSQGRNRLKWFANSKVSNQSPGTHPERQQSRVPLSRCRRSSPEFELFQRPPCQSIAARNTGGMRNMTPPNTVVLIRLFMNTPRCSLFSGHRQFHYDPFSVFGFHFDGIHDHDPVFRELSGSQESLSDCFRPCRGQAGKILFGNRF